MRPLPVIALLLSCAAVHAQTTPAMGRLFSTPSERDALDARRRNGPPPPAAAETAAPAQAEAPSAPPQVELNGIVRRSGGKSTIWLNDVAQPTGNDNLTGAATPGLKVATPSGTKITLRPGQRYDFNENRVKEANEP